MQETASLKHVEASLVRARDNVTFVDAILRKVYTEDTQLFENLGLVELWRF